MKTTKFTESQIVQALRECDGGKKAEAIFRELGNIRSTFYNRKKRYVAWMGISLAGINTFGTMSAYGESMPFRG